MEIFALFFMFGDQNNCLLALQMANKVVKVELFHHFFHFYDYNGNCCYSIKIKGKKGKKENGYYSRTLFEHYLSNFRHFEI